MRLTRAMIFVKDIRRMAEFYEKTLGLKPIEETRLENWVEFDAGRAGFSLHAIPSELAQDIEITSPPRPRERDPVKLTFEVDNLASQLRRLKSLGVPILDRPWGAHDGVDPEGNVFGIVESASATPQ